MRKSLTLATLIAVAFTGCLMPYQENFSCQADLNAGRCGMVRDNYKFGNENEQKDFLYSFDENKTKQIEQVDASTKTNCSNTKNFKELIKCHEENSKRYEYILIKKQRGE